MGGTPDKPAVPPVPQYIVWPDSHFAIVVLFGGALFLMSLVMLCSVWSARTYAASQLNRHIRMGFVAVLAYYYWCGAITALGSSANANGYLAMGRQISPVIGWFMTVTYYSVYAMFLVAIIGSIRIYCRPALFKRHFTLVYTKWTHLAIIRCDVIHPRGDWLPEKCDTDPADMTDHETD